VLAGTDARLSAGVSVSDFWIFGRSAYAALDHPVKRAMPKSVHSERHMMVAAALAEARRAKGMTQAQVAAALGRRQPFIANIESGERRVDLVELLDLSSIIDLDVEALIGQLKSARTLASGS